MTASLYTEIMADSPSGYWPMIEESGSTVYDLSSNGRNGTITGAVTQTPGSPAEFGSMTFTGATDVYVTVADNAAWSSGAGASGTVTFEAWIYRTVTSQRSIMSKGNSAGPLYEILGEVTATGAIKFDFIESGGASVATVQGGATALNTWHHVMVTFNRATPLAVLYVDGVQAASQSSFGAGNMSDTTGPLYFGTRFDGPLGSSTFGWTGRQAHVAMYSTALSAARVAAHYQAGLAELQGRFRYDLAVRATPGLVGYWPLNETSGTAAAGYGAAGNGVYTGTVTVGSRTTAPYLGASPDFGGGYVGITYDPGTPSGCTMEAWVTVDAFTGAGGDYISSIMGWEGSGAGTALLLRYGTDGTSGTQTDLQFFAATSVGTSSTAIKVGAGVVGVLHHVVGTFDGTTSRLYIDGVQVSSAAQGTGTIASGINTDLRIGVNPFNTTRTFDGTIAHAAVYNRALTATEILDHYRMGILGRAGVTVY